MFLVFGKSNCLFKRNMLKSFRQSRWQFYWIFHSRELDHEKRFPKSCESTIVSSTAILEFEFVYKS
jgi:hypothetical protein